MATAKQKNACDFLDADHKAVRKMFSEYEELADARGSSREKKHQLVERICREVTVRAQPEEEVVYPAVRKAIKDDLTMDEAGVEHASAKELIAQIQQDAERDACGADNEVRSHERAPDARLFGFELAGKRGAAEGAPIGRPPPGTTGRPPGRPPASNAARRLPPHPGA